MSCDSCTDKEKKQANEKLIADAKKQAIEKQVPIAICKEGNSGYYFIPAKTACSEPGHIIDQIVSHLQQAIDGPVPTVSL